MELTLIDKATEKSYATIKADISGLKGAAGNEIEKAMSQVKVASPGEFKDLLAKGHATVEVRFKEGDAKFQFHMNSAGELINTSGYKTELSAGIVKVNTANDGTARVTAFVGRGDVVDLKFAGGDVQIVGALAKVEGAIYTKEGLSMPTAGGDSQGGKGGSHGDYKLDPSGHGDWTISGKAWVRANDEGNFAVNLMQAGDTVQFGGATTVNFAGGVKSTVAAGVYTVTSDQLVRGGVFASAWAGEFR
jgi:hypothetical protein